MELATGAVSTLLGVIRSEIELLDGVRGDVQFIKEEMESMSSFLLHLARTAPPGGEHDEQVRTWMNQVRLLANDCNNCIDLYLYRGDPEIHLPTSGAGRCIFWAAWYLRKVMAQRIAATSLRELKERARDVGERRLRYSVEVPGSRKAAAAAAADAPKDQDQDQDRDRDQDQDQDSDDDEQALTAHHLSPPIKQALFGVCDLDEYLNEMVALWIDKQLSDEGRSSSSDTGNIPSIAIAAPALPQHDALVRQAMVVAAAKKTHFKINSVLIDIPAVHFSFLELETEDILCYIWRHLEQQQPPQSSPWQQGRTRWGIYCDKREAMYQIKNDADINKVNDKFEDVNNLIRQLDSSTVELDSDELKGVDLKEALKKKPLEALLVLLLRSMAPPAAAARGKARKKFFVPALQKSRPQIVEATSGVLAAYMGAHHHTRLDDAKYKQILEELSEDNVSSDRKPPQQQATKNTTTRALGEDEIKEMIHEVVRQELHEGQSGRNRAAAPAGQRVNLVVKVKPRKLLILQNTRRERQKKKQDHQIPEDVNNVVAENTNKQTARKIPEAEIEAAMKMMDEIRRKIKKLMKIQALVDKIKKYLGQEGTLVVVNVHGTGWKEVRDTLSLLPHIAGVLIVANKPDREYCHPPRDPMDYSTPGLYYDIVLQLMRKNQAEEDSDQTPQIIHDIVYKYCNPDEFCMKIFAHALYANPKRSHDELRSLRDALKVSPKSFGHIAKKLIKFSYKGLTRECKSCLLYLAIFPKEHVIRRSTLIRRWVVEGLVTTGDWRWSSSVMKAEKCFARLIDRWLVYPAEMGAAGKVKTCMVSTQVHDFITRIAHKQHIMDARLSHHLARHFNISNDIRLRGSDTIDEFLKGLSDSSQSSLLKVKVLDLEKCTGCFGQKKQHYLKDICRNISLLKYLSLKGTNATQLPSEINDLRELEVLDIRQTKIPASATRNILLVKLKHMRAGDTHPRPSIADFGSVQVPKKVRKMENMEVLSHIKPMDAPDFEDIGNLWNLRKLGVVIENKDGDIMNLLGAISNLHVGLKSLSIILVAVADHKGTSYNRGSSFIRNSYNSMFSSATVGSRLKNPPNPPKVLETLSITGSTKLNPPKVLRNSYNSKFSSKVGSELKDPPKILETLNITGMTKKVPLLQRLLGNDGEEMTKVTLNGTFLNQGDLDALGKLHKLRCLRLRKIHCNEGKLTFKKNEFQKLKYFLFEGSNVTDISFQVGAAPLLEEVVLSFIVNTAAAGPPNSKENESNNAAAAAIGADGGPNPGDHESSNNTTITSNNVKFLSLLQNISQQINKVTLRDTLLEEDGLQFLAKKPSIHSLALLEKSCVEKKLTFDTNEFPKLNLLVVQCPEITEISFTGGSAPKLGKIVWSVTSLSGICNLPKLKELEFIGASVPDELKDQIKNHRNKPHLQHNTPQNQGVTEESTPKGDIAKGSRLCCWKNKG